jgi:hypothetical protein
VLVGGVGARGSEEALKGPKIPPTPQPMAMGLQVGAASRAATQAVPPEPKTGSRGPTATTPSGDAATASPSFVPRKAKPRPEPSTAGAVHAEPPSRGQTPTRAESQPTGGGPSPTAARASATTPSTLRRKLPMSGL